MPTAKRPAVSRKVRGEARRRELLAEAARILLRDGLDGASMDLIASEAGASKATLYRHFGDRDSMVAEVVRHLCADFIADVDRDPPPGSDLRAGLRAILLQLVRVLAKPRHPDFFRLIVLGARRDPAIGEAWYRNGPLVWREMLARVFAQQIACGAIPADGDYADYPEMLFDAVFADMIIHTAVLGPDAVIGREPGRYLDKLLDAVLVGTLRNA